MNARQRDHQVLSRGGEVHMGRTQRASSASSAGYSSSTSCAPRMPESGDRRMPVRSAPTASTVGVTASTANRIRWATEPP